jgi:hypothetical protein
MTHDNLFQEVQEDLERQRLEKLWKRYGPLVIAAAVVIVVTTAGVTQWHEWQLKKEQKATAGLVSIMDQSKADPEQEIASLESFAQKSSEETQATFARLHAAALAAKGGKKDKALQLYDAVASDPKADPSFRQFADLMWVQTQLDSGDTAVLDKRLQPLTAPDAPWHFTATEYEGYVALRAGNKTKARQLFSGLAQDASAPRTLSDRAGDVLRYIGD